MLEVQKVAIESIWEFSEMSNDINRLDKDLFYSLTVFVRMRGDRLQLN